MTLPILSDTGANQTDRGNPMTHKDFGQLVLGEQPPTLDQRANVVRNALRDWHYKGGYVRVHAIKATTKSAVYAAVSYMESGERVLTYAVASLQCRRKGDGFWLSAECFLAAASTPSTLTECPREIFQAGEATGFASKLDNLWLSQCMQSLKVSDNIQAMKKGRIFKLDEQSPALTIGGERASFAIVLGKKKARYVVPTAGLFRELDVGDITLNYSPIPDHDIPTFTEPGGYAEAGELLFDLSGATPVLKGRLVVGAKAALIARDRNARDDKLGMAAQHFNFQANFQSGAWLS